MKTLFRILGTAAAVAVTGAAIVALDKILNQKDPLHVEEVEFPEDAEQNAEEAAKTAEAYAEAETKASDAANEKASEEAAPEAPAEEAAAAAQPAEEASAPAAPAEGGEKPVFDPEAPEPCGSRPRCCSQRRERKIRSHQDRRSQRLWRLGRTGLQRINYDPKRDDVMFTSPLFCYCPLASCCSFFLSSTCTPPRNSRTQPSCAKYFSIRLTTSRADPMYFAI